MTKTKAISILSGGLDSSVATAVAQENNEIVLALTFNYGQRAFESERKASASFCEHYGIPHRVIDLFWLGEISNSALNQKKQSLNLLSEQDLDHLSKAQESAKAVWVPNRNGLMLNVAACFAEALKANVLICGFNREEAATFPDNSEGFVASANQAFQYSTLNGVEVQAPLIDLDKKQILKKALDLKVPLPLLWSCYESDEKMCGTCESCLRSKRAYLENGLSAEMQQFFKS